MDNIFENFRLNLKFYRENRGWSQSQLAIQANSSNGMIGNIESGRAKPSFDSIVRIAEALSIHPADLFLREASKQADIEAFCKYSQLISTLNSIPEAPRSSIELMITDLGRKYR